METSQPSGCSKTPAWSYSALTAFETCPRRYYLTRVSKEVKETQNEAATWGNAVHTALEKRAKGEAPLPDHLAVYEPIIMKIISRDGKRIVEEKMTVTKSFKPTTWFAKDAWCRGIVDIGVVGDKQATVLDWKTGSRKPDSDQLKLFAAMAFSHYPWIERVTTGFVWLKENKIDKDKFTREQIGDLWNAFLPRVNRLEYAYAESKWPAKPSGLCRGWCPCTGCEFHQRRG